MATVSSSPERQIVTKLRVRAWNIRMMRLAQVAAPHHWFDISHTPSIPPWTFSLHFWIHKISTKWCWSRCGWDLLQHAHAYYQNWATCVKCFMMKSTSGDSFSNWWRDTRSHHLPSASPRHTIAQQSPIHEHLEIEPNVLFDRLCVDSVDATEGQSLYFVDGRRHQLHQCWI